MRSTRLPRAWLEAVGGDGGYICLGAGGNPLHEEFRIRCILWSCAMLHMGNGAKREEFQVDIRRGTIGNEIKGKEHERK